MRRVLLILTMLFIAFINAEEEVPAAEASVSFLVDSVTVPDTLLAKVSKRKLVTNNISWAKRVIYYSVTPDSLGNTYENGMMESLHKAYLNHYPISLSPEMIWLLILQGFATHIRLNSEEFLSDIVLPYTNKTIMLNCSEYERLDSIPWEKCAFDFVDSIQTRMPAKLFSALTPTFSTADPDFQIISAVAIMDIVEPYLKYEILWGCGFPSITVEGTPKDWNKLIRATKKLKKYKLKWWLDELLPILEEFKNASNGSVNRSFWKCILKSQNERTGYIPNKFFNGWMIKFFPYILSDEQSAQYKDFDCYYSKNRYMVNLPYSEKGIELNEFPSGYSAINVKMKSTTGCTIPLNLTAGFIGFEQDSVTKIVKPNMAWFVTYQ